MRFVFSRSAEFALTNEILDEHPEMSDPDRARERAVESGLCCSEHRGK